MLRQSYLITNTCSLLVRLLVIDPQLFSLVGSDQITPRSQSINSGFALVLSPIEPWNHFTLAVCHAVVGAWFLFLPPYSPDLNPIEMAFAKLKALIRRAAARTYDELWQAVGHVCNIFTDEEYYNFFKAAGYETD